jgi:hypothetical protein
MVTMKVCTTTVLCRYVGEAFLILDFFCTTLGQNLPVAVKGTVLWFDVYKFEWCALLLHTNLFHISDSDAREKNTLSVGLGGVGLS